MKVCDMCGDMKADTRVEFYKEDGPITQPMRTPEYDLCPGCASKMKEMMSGKGMQTKPMSKMA